ncbi:MAG: TetR/AcrR family transcriptional regulator [Deltaproteobacteria bacterium]|nr:TetR/AcrR family transcriptional regulator [Deltaproteobacteria bacterium]
MTVFSRKGYHGATMDEIARGAGYSPGAIYRYFSSKDEVFVAVAQSICEGFHRQMAEEPPVSLGFVDRLRWFLVRHLEQALQHREFFMAFVAYNSTLEWDHQSELGQPVTRCHEDIVGGFQDLVQRGLDEGVLRPGDPPVYARALKGLVRSLSIDELFIGEPGPVGPAVERIVEMFLHGAAAPEAG